MFWRSKNLWYIYIFGDKSVLSPRCFMPLILLSYWSFPFTISVHVRCVWTLLHRIAFLRLTNQTICSFRLTSVLFLHREKGSRYIWFKSNISCLASTVFLESRHQTLAKFLVKWYFLLLLFTDTLGTRVLNSNLWLLLPSVVALFRIWGFFLGMHHSC